MEMKELGKKYNLLGWEEILDKNINIILNNEQMELLVKKMGCAIDVEGFIIDPATKERKHSIDSAEINIKELGAIMPGSTVFIKKNIASFSQYLAEYYEKSQ